jgi:hypothetical protein
MKSIQVQYAREWFGKLHSGEFPADEGGTQKMWLRFITEWR